MSTLDDDLHDPQLSALYRQLPDAEPGADTDARLRAAARRAVRAGPRQWLFSFETRRLAGAAAMLLIGAGLVLQWQAREPQVLEEAIGPATALRVEPQADKVAPEAAPPAESATPPIRKSLRAERDSPSPASRENPVADVVAPPAPAAPAAKMEAQNAAELAAAGGTAATETPVAQAAPAAELRLDDQLRRSETLREMEASASRRERKSAQMERQLASPPADYRALMTQGRHVEALAVVSADTVAATVDRDLLRQLLGDTSAPACFHLSQDALGDERRLCDLLALRQRKQALPANWRQQLEDSGLISGARAYRRDVVEKLFSPPPRL